VPIRIAAKPNGSWKRYMADGMVTVTATPLVAPTDHFFLMGSCFAEEIRRALENRLGLSRVGPDYRQVKFDPATAKVDELPDRNHLNTYNAFSVLQEIERILGLWTPAPDDFWQVGDRVQCPYRRLVFADTPQELARITADLDAVLRAGFAAAGHFIFTFGMTEVFENRVSGRIANQKPGYGKGGGVDETVYRRASFAENLAAIQRIVALIAKAKPAARVFMTVSPVPLMRTHSGEDVYIANSLSKATLRAVLGEVAATCPSVTYFPSYEAVIAGGAGAWQEDGRHVLHQVVHSITDRFVDTYISD
jgi:GSCFA family